MARVNIPEQLPPTTIDRFLGENQSTTGDTQLQLGEASVQINLRLLDNSKLSKREGYSSLFNALLTPIRGIWEGRLNATDYFLFATGGNIYKRVGEVVTSIGTLTDAQTEFFAYGSKVYIINGYEYKSFDGTTFETVAGYRPVIATVTPPTGGGTPNEQLNLLTGEKEQWFSPDGTATDFVLNESTIDSVDFVKNRSDGTVYVENTDYTVNLTTGTVTFSIAPAGGNPDSISIGWTKGTGQRSEVTGYRFAMFYGGKNDTRIFLYGNGTHKYIYTGLASGVPSAEYFPANNSRIISTDEYEVTGIERQHDRQLIYTSGGEAWYSYYDPITDSAGNTLADFPTYPLNNKIGNVAIGQTQLIENNPFSIQNGIHEWVATDVRDERNAQYKSKRVQPSLNAVDLKQAITVDWESKKEYWLSVGNKIWIYNYRLDAWYRFELADNITCFLLKNDELYFGTPNGEIMKFDDSRNDNGTPFELRWEMNFYSFEAEYLKKYLATMWISLKPENKSSVEISYQTDRQGTSDIYTAKYSLASFEDADFSDWSFLVNYNPQPFHFKIKAKKFVYFKLILTNNKTDELLTILSINLPARMGSKVK